MEHTNHVLQGEDRWLAVPVAQNMRAVWSCTIATGQFIATENTTDFPQMVVKSKGHPPYFRKILVGEIL